MDPAAVVFVVGVIAGGNTAPVKTLAGAATGLNGPYSLAFDAGGRMHVANYGNSTVTVYGK